MDPNNGGWEDEQNWQFFEEDPLPFTVDQLRDLLQDDQAEAGTVQPDPPLEVLVSGYGPDLSEFPDSTVINQGNQAIAGTVQPDPPQVVSEVPVSGYGPYSSGFADSTLINQRESCCRLRAKHPEDKVISSRSVTVERRNFGEEEIFYRWPGDMRPYLTKHEQLRFAREISCPRPNSEYQNLGRVPLIPPLTQPHLGQPECTNAGSQAAAGDQNRLARKRENDRAYRQRKKARTQELEVENLQLKAFEAEVGRLNHEIQENKHLVKSKLIILLHKNLDLKGKIKQLQEDNRTMYRQLETQSGKLHWLQDKLELLDPQTGNEKAKETLKGIAKKLGALRTENEELMAAVKDKETLLQSLLSGLESIRNQLDQLLKEMLHDTGERGFCQISEC